MDERRTVGDVGDALLADRSVESGDLAARGFELLRADDRVSKLLEEMFERAQKSLREEGEDAPPQSGARNSASAP